MTVSSQSKLNPTIEYLEEDFEPMPEGDKQRQNLSYTTEALKVHFEPQADVYVSGNLFIYYEEGNADKKIAPDTFVVFGSNKADRTSYKLWLENNRVPDFVLEITSKGTVSKDRDNNPLLYRTLGVKEYFQYDPSGEYLKPTSLQGVRLEQGQYVEIASRTLPNGVLSLHSETLGLDLHLYPDKRFRFFDPSTGEVLRSHSESERSRLRAEAIALQERLDKERAEAIARQEHLAKEQAEAIALQERLDKERAEAIALQERLDKERAEAIALQERLDKERAEAIAAQERQEKLQERQEKEKLAAYLRSLDIDPDQI
jgi:Uma2 family endonuclease